jgi:hypothetical protein
MINPKMFLTGLLFISAIILGTVYTASYSSSAKLYPSSLAISDKSQIKDGVSYGDLNKIKIGMVNPVFTEAAYNHKFYIFYAGYAHVPFRVNVTKNLSLLNSKVLVSNTQNNLTSNNNPWQFSSNKDVKDFSHKIQIYALSDLDVDKGNIFDNDNGKQLNIYNVLVLGHQEYVTQKEYDNLKQFVYNGGTMILLDGNIFYAEVKYFGNNNTISLVNGHGWAYNGKTAWRSVDERWKDETSQWVGSNYLCDLCIKSFKNNPFGYLPHEEQYITNPNDKILFNYNPIELPSAPKPNVAIAMYSLDFGKGKVISFGIYSDDIIQNANFLKFFTDLLMGTVLHPIG